MFVDFRDQPPPRPWQPRSAKKGPQLTSRQQCTLGTILGVNVLLLLIAPIGGATLIELLGIMWR
jgi:hypothetical protein